MQQTLLTAFYASLVVMFVTATPPYRYALSRYAWFDRKPFNCLFCLSWWWCLIVSLLIFLSHGDTWLTWLLAAPASAVTSSIIERIVNSLTVSI